MPATPRKLTPNSEKTEAYLRAVERQNATREKGTKTDDGNWEWHTEECCRRVWRKVGWGCVR